VENVASGSAIKQPQWLDAAVELATRVECGVGAAARAGCGGGVAARAGCGGVAGRNGRAEEMTFLFLE
jgi:hypothetical protein